MSNLSESPPEISPRKQDVASPILVAVFVGLTVCLITSNVFLVNRMLKLGIVLMFATLALTAGQLASGDQLIRIVNYFDGCSGDCLGCGAPIVRAITANAYLTGISQPERSPPLEYWLIFPRY